MQKAAISTIQCSQTDNQQKQPKHDNINHLTEDFVQADSQHKQFDTAEKT